MDNRRSMTLEYDDNAEKVLAHLQSFFGVRGKAETMRRSLALARALSKYADGDRTLSITEPKTNMTVKLCL